MKKTFFLLFAFLLVNINAMSQCNQRPNADHYLLQGNTYLHIDEIDLDIFDNNGSLMNILSGAVVSSVGDDGLTIRDAAQLQYSDTLHTIVGVSALLIRHNYGTTNAYLCLADSNFNVYRRIRIPSVDTSLDCNYTELFFEQPINVNGKFSIIWDNPKPGFTPDIYNFNNTDHIAHGNHARLHLYPIFKDTNNCGLYIKAISDGYTPGWTYYFDDPLFSFIPYRYVAALFPIFGDLDTTLSLVGQPEDTITQPEDTSSLTRINMVDKYSHIFPNPAKDELNIQCSFKINDIEIYNSLGQKVFSKEVNKYSTTLNTIKFKKDIYIIKINTVNGITHKKFIIQ